MSIGHRLTLGILVMAILVGAVGIIGYVQTRKISADFERVTDVANPAFGMLGRMQLSMVESANDVFAYSLSGEQVHKEQFYERMDKFDLFAGQFAAIAQIEQPGEEDLLKSFQQINVAKARLMSSANNIFESYDTNPLLDSRTIQLFEDDVQQSNLIFRELFSRAGVKVRNAREDADGTVAFSSIALPVAAALAVVIALTIGHLISRSISRPIGKLTEAASSISKGDLSARLDYTPGKDEISGLSSSFNDMASKLEESHGQLQRNLAELKMLAATLQFSNRELEQFASIASHDLQEPLRKVRAFGELLKSGYADTLSDQGQDYLRRMLNAADRMQTLIDDLLTLSRVTTKGEPFVPVDLGAIAEEVLNDLEISINQSGGIVEVSDLPVIDADPTQMRQLLQNIISNSLKFHQTSESPVVKVRSQFFNGPSTNGDGDASGNGLVSLEVEDNGIGFDEKYLDRIFNVFQRLHGRGEYDGAGIGLAVCRKIAERHGGTITAKSEPGQGATFIITLPMKQPQGKDMILVASAQV